MTTEPNDHVDGQLREAFAVDEAAANRVADEAFLASRHRRPSRPPLHAALALASLALCAGLAVWLSRPTVGPPPARPAGVTELSGSFADGVLVVPIPDDGVVIATPGLRDDRPSDGCGIVFVEGDVR